MSVTGGLVSVQIRDDLPSTLTLVQGESHRVGQIGSFLRIPLGYASLFGVVTQVGAAAAPTAHVAEAPDSHRWVSLVLFGEAVSGTFERGVSQYPTVGDEVHVVTTDALEVIYTSERVETSIDVGSLSAAAGIPGTLDLNKLVARHVAVVGSTGSGKSNLVAVLLDSIATQGFPSARVLVLDPHGEYGSAVADNGYVFKIRPTGTNDKQLAVPYWALPADEFIAIAMGKLQPGAHAAVRDAISDMRASAATSLASPPPFEVVNADSPIPFSARKLWFELDDYERRTLINRQTGEECSPDPLGDATTLRSNIYPPPSSGNVAPFVGPRRGIVRQLELMRSRLQDSRYSFLFSPAGGLEPNVDGQITTDLDQVVQEWVGHDRTVTVLDLSGLPAEAMASVAGTVLRIVYDTLYWAGDLPVSGRSQPLLVAIEEAHRVLPAGIDTPALRVTSQIAKEGRKYGVGLMVITQRPTEVEPTILSQCGTMIALRMANGSDRSVVAGMMPDDLGNLAAMLPSLRTGEGMALGEAMPIPTRMRFRRARNKPVGDDPNVVEAWKQPERPSADNYEVAVNRWRKQED